MIKKPVTKSGIERIKMNITAEEGASTTPDTVYLMYRYARIIDMLEEKRQTATKPHMKWLLSHAITATILAAAEAVGALECKD